MQTLFDDHDALGLAQLVRKGEVYPTELLQASVARIEARNPALNAVVRTMYDEAQASIDAGLPHDGPLAGVPFLLKDLRAQYQGVPTTSGSAYFADAVATHDSESVRRYRRAGLVIAGKTNTPEFGGSPSTEPRLFGPCRNPWGHEFSAGGSSGGSAAAVAAGMVPAAHGSDGGGSIRIPAACCGLFGMKPSRGVIPAGPDLGEAWNGLSSEHVITRSVRDSAALLDATAGPAPGDPYRGPTPQRPFLDEVDRDPGRLRIAVQRSPASGAPVDADCLAALDDAVALLEELGHDVEEAAPAYDAAPVGPAYRLLVAANVNAAIAERAEQIGRRPEPGELETVIERLAAEADQASSTDTVRAIWTCHRTGRAVAPFFDDYDLCLSPTVATPPPRLGELDTMSDDVDGYLGKVFSFIPFTSLQNIAGLPGMSVPLWWNEQDLPIGVHFGAGYGRDGLLFRLAAQLERARPWFDRRPAAATA